MDMAIAGTDMTSRAPWGRRANNPGAEMVDTKKATDEYDHAQV
jgi:hypothetical protein